MSADDEPTTGELTRRFDGVERRLELLADAIAKLPSADLIATQQMRVSDRVSQNERDIASIRATIDKLAEVLAGEKEARRIALETAERTRRVEMDAEKARIGTWFRWLAGILAPVVGAVVALLAGIRG